MTHINPSLAELPGYVDQLDQLLLQAEKCLKSLAEPALIEVDCAQVLQEYEGKRQRIDEIHQVLIIWDGLSDASVSQKSEIKRSLGQLRRLTVVSKNIVRILRQTLNIPDPERMQEEMELQMMRVAALHGNR